MLAGRSRSGDETAAPFPASHACPAVRGGRLLARASLVFLERHPALLSGDADDILTDLRALASARGDSAAAHTFEVHQTVLRSYLKLGAAAFDELIAPGVPATLRAGWVAAEAAHERYRARPSREAADTAVHAITAVLQRDDFATVPPAARAGMHQAAGTLLGERYQRHGGPVADLDAAVTCFTAAVRELPDGAPDRPSYTSALGNVLGMRYEERGDPADLDEGIRCSREAAVGMRPKNDGGFCTICPTTSAFATRCSATRLI